VQPDICSNEWHPEADRHKSETESNLKVVSRSGRQTVVYIYSSELQRDTYSDKHNSRSKGHRHCWTIYSNEPQRQTWRNRRTNTKVRLRAVWRSFQGHKVTDLPACSLTLLDHLFQRITETDMEKQTDKHKGQTASCLKVISGSYGHWPACVQPDIAGPSVRVNCVDPGHWSTTAVFDCHYWTTTSQQWLGTAAAGFDRAAAALHWN